MRLGLGLSRGLRQGGNGTPLTAVDVVFVFGASQAAGVRNTITELPSGYYTTDASAYIWDRFITNTIVPLTAATFATATITIASPGVVSWTAHGLTNGMWVAFETTGALPTGLLANTRYFVVNKATDTFQLAATSGGAAINTSGSQSGVHTAVANGALECQPLGPDVSDGTAANRFPNAVGWCGEFVKHYRTDHASSSIYFFIHQMGGGRFSDAGSLGRTVNYTYNLTDGAYASLKASWAAFVSALASLGKTPNIILLADDSIGNGAADATESGNYQTDMSNLITQLRTDIVGNIKWVHCQLSSQMTALNSTNRTTIRGKQQNIVSASSTINALLQCDGLPTTTFDNLHFKAASHLALGELLYYESQSYWHPLKEWAFLSQNQTADCYRPGDFRNTAGATAFTLSGGNVATCWDCVAGSVLPTQATNTKRPTITTNTVANGYVARVGVGDGATQILTAPSATGFASAAAYGTFAAAKSLGNTSLDSLFAEGSTTANPFYEPMRQDGTSALTGLARNDANTIFLNGSTLGATAWNSAWNFLAVWGTASQVSGQVNGTAGTPVSITRGTITCNRFSLFGAVSGGTEAHQINAHLGELWITAAVPDATYLANAQAYCQRRWGTA